MREQQNEISSKGDIILLAHLLVGIIKKYKAWIRNVWAMLLRYSSDSGLNVTDELRDFTLHCTAKKYSISKSF